MTDGPGADATRESLLRKLGSDWGYQLLPRSHPGSPGYTGLLVSIQKQPAGARFRPKNLRLLLGSREGVAEWRTLSWRSPPLADERICPGPLLLSDWLGERIDFYTFGGSLEVIPGHEELILSVRSPAPILELIEQKETIADQLASGTEALVGQLRANWGRDDVGFSRRLAELHPFQFYLACLQSLLLSYECSQALEEVYHECRDALLREKEWLITQGLWPANAPTLEDLLSPDQKSP
jgi:hypothetical protein